MPGNSFGQVFRVMTFGESHGPAIGAVVDGVIPLLPLSAADIQVELDRRRPGQSNITTQRKESDTVEILSGVFEGKTTGAPIALLIRNEDAKSKDYEKFKDAFRPGHADFTYDAKFGIRDWRGGGRSSGRETAARVAVGAIAKKILLEKNIKVIAYTLAVGDIYAKKIDLSIIESNAVRCPDAGQAEAMIQKIQEVRKNGDSIGGIVEAVVRGCPPGLGDPVFDKLNAKLAAAVMSIGTIRGVEFGSGFASAKMNGSESNDVFFVQDGQIKTKTNHAGGILGGISTGADIVLRVAVKPPSSISIKQQTVTKAKENVEIQVTGRHDPCICPRVVPVVEAMVAMTLVDCLMLQGIIKR
ncbi:MAG: chorismate synthase [Candidatus Omnitrophota bacterium]